MGVIAGSQDLSRGTAVVLQHGHSHCHAVFNLVFNQAQRTVSDIRTDLKSFVHRTGMHHRRVRFCQCQTLGVDAPHPGVLVDIR